MTASDVSGKRTDTRREVKVAPNLYRQVGTDRYRFARMADGVSVFERFTSPTLTEAKKHADALRTRKPSSFGDKSVTVEALAKSYLDTCAEKLAATTVVVRRHLLNHHVVPALGPRMKAVDVEPAHLRRMIRKLTDNGLAGASVRSCVASASAMFAHGVRDLAAIPRNPARELEHGDRPSAMRQTEPRYLSVAEVAQLLAKMSDESRPIAATCFWAALRVSEALSLRWSDIDFEAKLIRVPGTKTKASKASVPLLPALAAELKAHRERQASQGFDRIGTAALVFQTATGLSPGRRNVLRAVTNAGRRAGLQPEGIEPVGVHDLRHSFAAHALNGGLSMVEAARVLRHANPHVTAAIYAGMTDEAVSALGSKLEAIS
jgi:integrase